MPKIEIAQTEDSKAEKSCQRPVKKTSKRGPVNVLIFVSSGYGQVVCLGRMKTMKISIKYWPTRLHIPLFLLFVGETSFI